jgi:hypothetical protein
MKNKTWLLATSICILASCINVNITSNSGNSGSDKSKKSSDGWVSLFDGKTTSGWHSYGKDKVDEVWKVVDGAICLTDQKDRNQASGGDLVSDKEYGDFDLKLEWKIAKNGNSGIIFYVVEDAAKYKESYNTGMEMQVLDNDGHPDGKLIRHRAGDLYDLISSSKESVKPVGEWNEVEIISKDGKLQLFLNGTNVVTTQLWDDQWRSKLAGSKFKNMQDFGTFKKGKIALQDHSNLVCYRNIKIKEL